MAKAKRAAKPKSSSPKSNPLFISFEGGEGVGKTTLIKTLYEALKKAGHQVIVTREPGGTDVGTDIRDLLLHRPYKMSSKSELFLYLAARADNVEKVILPALRAGKIVLCDRFNDSTMAYQGTGRNLGLADVSFLCKYSSEGLNPDLTFYLDLTPEKGRKRRKANSGKLDRIESENNKFHEKVRKSFLTIAEQASDRVKVLDASKSPEDVFSEAWSHIQVCL